jgi:site-specific DNA-methyltransferase (adenine-specific)
MKVYFQNDLTTIYHGKYVPGHFDAMGVTVVSDPPYNVGYHYDQFEDKMSESDYYSMMALVFKGRSVVIHYPEAMHKISIAMGVAPERQVAWVYPSNTPRQHRSIAWYGCKPDFRKEGQDYRNPTDPRIAKRIAEGKRAKLYDWWQINQVKNVSSEKTEHPCQIPLSLMERLIKITPATIVLDPFAGSGTTLLACQNLGVRSIGVEMSEKYCEIMANRLSRLF